MKYFLLLGFPVFIVLLGVAGAWHAGDLLYKGEYWMSIVFWSVGYLMINKGLDVGVLIVSNKAASNRQ